MTPPRAAPTKRSHWRGARSVCQTDITGRCVELDIQSRADRFDASQLHITHMTLTDLLHAFVPGALVLLASIARAEAQVRVLVCRSSEAAARRNRRLGGLCSLLAVGYAYGLGADGWSQCASWINTACSVAGALATGAAQRTTTPAVERKEDKLNG